MKSDSLKNSKIRLAITAVIIALLAFMAYSSYPPGKENFIMLVIVVLGIYQFINILMVSLPREDHDVITKETVYEPPAENLRDEKTEAELVHLLSLLQEKGRFIDFVMDDITPYDDDRVAAAARVVHQGCRKFFQDNFNIDPVEKAEEGNSVTLDKGYNVAEYRLVGNVSSEPPHSGTLLHRGWRVSAIKMSRLTDSALKGGSLPVIAPAEIEVT